MTVIWKAFVWTAIPIVALSIVSTVAAVGVSGSAFWLGFFLVFGAAGVWLVATRAMVVLYARGTRESASGILKAFAWTAIPIVFLSIVSTAGAAVGVSGSAFWLGFYVVWYGAAGVWLVATIAMVVLYARGTRESASGILKAFAWTAIPIVTLSIVSTGGAAYGVSGVQFWIGFYFVWFGAAGVWLVATMAMVVLYPRGTIESPSGIVKAFAWTAIPIVALSIVSTAGAAYGVSGVQFWLGFYLVWFGAASLWLVATMAMVVLYARGTRESASGILTGIGVGVLALDTTGLVNFATIQATFQ